MTRQHERTVQEWTVSTSVDHRVEIDFGYYLQTRLICDAGPHAPCRAVFDCGCEEWEDLRDDHGTPTHRPLREWPDDPHPLHVGAYDAAHCTLRDWFENDDECFGGTATFPVTATWTDGHYVFTLAGGAS